MIVGGRIRPLISIFLFLLNNIIYLFLLQIKRHDAA